MILKQLQLTNFRSYTEREFVFSPDVTVISGKNGTGKTNILEAIYLLLQGKSFRDSDEQLIKHDEEWWKVRGEFNELTRELRFVYGQPNPKQLYIDNVVKGRFSYRQQLPVVLFEPDHLSLLHGSPSLRRQYLDTLLLSVESTYRTSLGKYERALLQRNNLLKRGGSLSALRDAVFVWDIALSEYGAELQAARQKLVDSINTQLSEYYSTLAGSDCKLETVYLPSGAHYSQGLVHAYAQSLEKDVARGFTGVGPHRDDVQFMLGGKDAKTTASRGEVRTIVLALKYTELTLLQSIGGYTPLLLLDDVFSELDTTRQRALLANTEGVQKIITTTHAPAKRAKTLTISLV